MASPGKGTAKDRATPGTANQCPEESTLVKLSDDDLVAQIEEKVGADLQYIRLNEAVVGSMVGMDLALIKRLLA